MRAYAELFDAGHVHSFEVWNEKGELAGGGYGVAIGGAFATKSQFSREPNTSKIGFTVLNWHLARWGFAFNDGKVMTPTCRDMGFREIAAWRIPGTAGRCRAKAGAAGTLAGRELTWRRWRNGQPAALIIQRAVAAVRQPDTR